MFLDHSSPSACIDAPFSTMKSHLKCYLQGASPDHPIWSAFPLSCYSLSIHYGAPISFKAFIINWVISAFVCYVSNVLLPFHCNSCKGGSHVCCFKFLCAQSEPVVGMRVLKVFLLSWTEDAYFYLPLSLGKGHVVGNGWCDIQLTVWDPPGLSPML